jgi:hypothetical protein
VNVDDMFHQETGLDDADDEDDGDGESLLSLFPSSVLSYWLVVLGSNGVPLAFIVSNNRSLRGGAFLPTAYG